MSAEPAGRALETVVVSPKPAGTSAAFELCAVVPTYNSARTVARCVESLHRQRRDGALLAVQVLVVDNHSTDATRELAAQAGATVIVAGDERCAQRNVGWRSAGAPAVLFVDSDMVVDTQVCAQVLDELAAGAVAVVVPERSFGSGVWAKARALEKLLCDGDTRSEAARGFRVEMLEAVGGWDETLVAGEDWELTDRVARLGRLGRSEAVIHHDEGRPTLRSVWRKKRYYGGHLARWVSRGGTSGRTSVRRLARRPRLWLSHPRAAVALVVLKSVDAAAVWSAVVQQRAGAWTQRLVRARR